MEWIKELHNRINKDLRYQKQLKQTEKLEQEFRLFLATLSCAQQELVERYIAACEELDHLLMIAAYELGKDNTTGR